jgi:hypothetical protein
MTHSFYLHWSGDLQQFKQIRRLAFRRAGRPIPSGSIHNAIMIYTARKNIWPTILLLTFALLNCVHIVVEGKLLDIFVENN